MRLDGLIGTHCRANAFSFRRLGEGCACGNQRHCAAVTFPNEASRLRELPPPSTPKQPSDACGCLFNRPVTGRAHDSIAPNDSPSRHRCLAQSRTQMNSRRPEVASQYQRPRRAQSLSACRLRATSPSRRDSQRNRTTAGFSEQAGCRCPLLCWWAMRNQVSNACLDIATCSVVSNCTFGGSLYCLNHEAARQGMTAPQVGHLLGDSPRAVEYWVHRSQERGLAGLVDAMKPGRPKRLTCAQLKKLGVVLRHSPQKLGLNAASLVSSRRKMRIGQERC